MKKLLLLGLFISALAQSAAAQEPRLDLFGLPVEAGRTTLTEVTDRLSTREYRLERIAPNTFYVYKRGPKKEERVGLVKFERNLLVFAQKQSEPLSKTSLTKALFEALKQEHDKTALIRTQTADQVELWFGSKQTRKVVTISVINPDAQNSPVLIKEELWHKDYPRLAY